MKEEDTEEDGVTIDRTVYSITVNVTDDGNGQLAAEVTGAEDISFENCYEDENPPTYDDGHMTLFLVSAFLLCAGLVGMVMFNKKAKKRKQ